MESAELNKNGGWLFSHHPFPDLKVLNFNLMEFVKPCDGMFGRKGVLMNSRDVIVQARLWSVVWVEQPWSFAFYKVSFR